MAPPLLPLFESGEVEEVDAFEREPQGAGRALSGETWLIEEKRGADGEVGMARGREGGG